MENLGPGSKENWERLTSVWRNCHGKGNSDVTKVAWKSREHFEKERVLSVNFYIGKSNTLGKYPLSPMQVCRVSWNK